MKDVVFLILVGSGHLHLSEEPPPLPSDWNWRIEGERCHIGPNFSAAIGSRFHGCPVETIIGAYNRRNNAHLLQMVEDGKNSH